MIDSYGAFDHIFRTKLDSWVLIQKIHEVFSQREFDLSYIVPKEFSILLNE